ncbi:MAG: hypothetical protein HN466_03045 [Candidatus Pacebacteria bacterium]|nr:hypothetical protein [Candidatus Paceibacterota bacterium]
MGWFILGILFFFLLIFARLVDIQLFRGHYFLDLANDNRYFTIQLPAQRGVFFDRYQQSLVWNKRVYLKTDDPTTLHPKTTSISREEALQLLATDSAQVRYGLERDYRFPESVAHVLGYVGPVTKDNLIEDNSLKVSDVIGKMGLEKIFDQRLRGQAASEVYEINALGKRQRLISKNAGQIGQNIATSLDPYLSKASLESLGGQAGAVVIMDASNSEVLTLLSSPSFDANVLSTRLTDVILERQRQQQLQDLLSNPLQIFFNRSLSGAYPPGSVFKLVTALGGLEEAVIDAQTVVLDEGVLRVGEYEYANWYYTQYGRTEGEISLQRSLSRSNDIYFYKVAEWLGPNKLAEFARLFGFGQVTKIELLGETAGVVPDPSWKERVIGEPWYLGNTFHMGIGQGDILVTPLQVGQMTQAIANHGTLCQPTLLKKDHADCSELGIADENLELVLLGMLDACSSGGTAYPFFPHNEIYRDEEMNAQQQIKNGAVACKTGTSEFGGADEKGYRKTHAWLTMTMGTAGLKDVVGRDDDEHHRAWIKQVKEAGFPEKIVITVLVESDEDNPFKEGSRDAGEVAKEIVDWMYGK